MPGSNNDELLILLGRTVEGLDATKAALIAHAARLDRLEVDVARDNVLTTHHSPRLDAVEVRVREVADKANGAATCASEALVASQEALTIARTVAKQVHVDPENRWKPVVRDGTLASAGGAVLWLLQQLQAWLSPGGGGQ